jgi:pimeloyl-ACP methyl ester carboxylesterase
MNDRNRRVCMTFNPEYWTDTLVSNGKKLHIDLYQIGKEMPVVLFIPGMGCYAGIYGDFLKRLSGCGFNVIGIDLVGHGRSEGKRGTFTFREVMLNISDCAAYARFYFNDRIGLMGSSLGGTYALYAAMFDGLLKSVLCHNAMDISTDLYIPTRFPGVTRLMLNHARFIASLFSILPIPLRILVDWLKVVDNPSLLKKLKSDSLMVWTYSLGSWVSFLDYKPTRTLKEIQIPVKIIVGSEDRLFPPSYCRTLSGRIGTNGIPCEIIQGGHALPLESIPDLLPATVRWFENSLYDKRSNHEISV